jgi:hypothetical protein
LRENARGRPAVPHESGAQRLERCGAELVPWVERAQTGQSRQARECRSGTRPPTLNRDGDDSTALPQDPSDLGDCPRAAVSIQQVEQVRVPVANVAIDVEVLDGTLR